MNAPILAFYGDDLTGSTDVLEALTLRGVRTVLFTAEPSPSLRARFADVVAIGLAGTSRSETPDWMDANLPGAFGYLAATGAPLCHYKVCSTFDSAPAIGSIGRALEIGRRVFGPSDGPDRRRRARASSLDGVRSPVRGLWRHGPSDRPAPGDAPASGDPDGRGGSPSPSRATDHPADRPREPCRARARGRGRDLGRARGRRRGAAPRRRRRGQSARRGTAALPFA